DINNDGNVNPVDVVFIVNKVYLLNELEGFAEEAADINGDGNVNPVDVVFMVNKVYMGNSFESLGIECPCGVCGGSSPPSSPPQINAPSSLDELVNDYPQVRGDLENSGVVLEEEIIPVDKGEIKKVKPIEKIGEGEVKKDEGVVEEPVKEPEKETILEKVVGFVADLFGVGGGGEEVEGIGRKGEYQTLDELLNDYPQVRGDLEDFGDKIVEETQTCTDSDGGINYYVKGIAGDLWDYCEDSNLLHEAFCLDKEEGYADYINYTCPNGCVDGVCVSSSCDCGKWGDLNGDGAINPVDVVFMVNYAYLSNNMIVDYPNCPLKAGDVNCDGARNPVDAVYYVNRVHLTNDMFCENPCVNESPNSYDIYIVKDTDTLLRASSFIRKEGRNNPLIVYTLGKEYEIINFLNSFNLDFSLKLIYLGDNDFSDLENELNTNEISFEKTFVGDLVIENFDFISFSDNEELKPYAATWAGKNNGLFLDLLADIGIYLTYIPSQKIVYFGNNVNILNQLSSYSSSIEQIPTLSQAEIKLAQTDSGDKIVTVIPKIPSDYSRLGVLYSIYRDTALISVTGAEDDAFSFDDDINEQLNLIKPYNNNQEYSYMVVVADWFEIPYNYEMPTYIINRSGEPYPYRLSSDIMYADRNSYWSSTDIGDEDKHFAPDMSVGRILGYDLTSASIVLNMGYLNEKGFLEKSKKAVYSSDWRIDGTGFRGEIPLEIINALNIMYGESNVYAIGDPDDINYGPNNPLRDDVLTLSKDREFILYEGHGNPLAVSATNPSIKGEAILDKRPYKPALWYLDACATIEYYPYGSANLDSALRSLATNVYGTVDVWATGSGGISWYMPYFAQGYRIGDVIRLGLQDASVYFNDFSEETINANALSQWQIIGDPLVSYGQIQEQAPQTAMKLSPIFKETSENKKIIYIDNSRLNIIYPFFKPYTFRFEENCGELILIESSEALQKIKDIGAVDYNEIKNLVLGMTGAQTDILQESITSFDSIPIIVSEKGCKLIFEKFEEDLEASGIELETPKVIPVKQRKNIISIVGDFVRDLF
ncbi:MAG: hypothetical protein KKB31_04220, partial [Nanoarchaeota archaeon]|nr:hypothetical protein [Nanoarchaeota archaeon]